MKFQHELQISKLCVFSFNKLGTKIRKYSKLIDYFDLGIY